MALRNSYSTKNTTLNNVAESSGDYESNNGQTIDSLNEIYKDINLAEIVFDTYIGGDNDGDGYYLDYNSDGTKLVEKNIAENPLTFDLTGSGTNNNPYIINSKEDLKKVNLQLKKVYKVNNDIEFTSDDKYYVIGSRKNWFTGTFDGNKHTISGIKLNNKMGINYIGMFGYTSATIKNVTLTNVDIFGNDYVGGISGYYEGTMTNIILSGKISGNGKVGGITGYGGIVNGAKVTATITGKSNYVGGISGGNNSVTNADVKATVTGNNYVGGITGNGNVASSVMNGDISGYDFVGGITGKTIRAGNPYNTVKAVYKGGNVSGNSNVNLILGADNGSTILGYSINGSTLNNENITSASTNSLNGKVVDLNELTKSNYEELGFSFNESTDNPYWIYKSDGIVTLANIN